MPWTSPEHAAYKQKGETKALIIIYINAVDSIIVTEPEKISQFEKEELEWKRQWQLS